MVIGIHVPPRHVPRVRSPWRYGGSTFARHSMILRAGIQRVVSFTRALCLRIKNGANGMLPLRARARQRQRAQLDAFERQYEALIGLLCSAAHEGIHRDRHSAYRRTRSWLAAHYSSIERHVKAHWTSGAESGSDPFLALLAHGRLEEAINVDTAVDDMMRSRTALEAYRSELEQTRL